MAGMLRDWLAIFLVSKIEAAWEWKKSQTNDIEPAILRAQDFNHDVDHVLSMPEEVEPEFCFEKDLVSINVDKSFEVGEIRFLQLEHFYHPALRYSVNLSDGRTKIRASFDDDAIRAFEKRYNRSLTQVSGGIINPLEFTIRLLPLDRNDQSIVLTIKNFTYRSGSAGTGTVGHPIYAKSHEDVRPLVQRFWEWLETNRGSIPERAPGNDFVHAETSGAGAATHQAPTHNGENETTSSQLASVPSDQFATQVVPSNKKPEHATEADPAPAKNLTVPASMQSSLFATQVAPRQENPKPISEVIAAPELILVQDETPLSNPLTVTSAEPAAHVDTRQGQSKPSPKATVTTEPILIEDEMPYSQPVSTPPTQLATQVAPRRRQPKRCPDISLASGTNLAHPVGRASGLLQTKKNSTAALNLLQALAVQPHLPRVSGQVVTAERSTPNVAERDTATADRDVVVIDGDEDAKLAADLLDHDGVPSIEEDTNRPAQWNSSLASDLAGKAQNLTAGVSTTVVERGRSASPDHQQGANVEDVGPAPSEKTEDILQNTEKHAEDSVTYATRRPDPKYVKYARRKLDQSQREVLAKPISWIPSEGRLDCPPFNIPLHILQDITAMHNGAQSADPTLTATETSPTKANIAVELPDAASPTGAVAEAELSDEYSPEDATQPIGSWPTSPVREYQTLAANQMPPDSSAFSALPSSPPMASSDEMDIDDGSDGSELKQALPRVLPTEANPYHKVIRATPAQSATPHRADVETPAKYSSSIVVESNPRSSVKMPDNAQVTKQSTTTALPVKRRSEGPDQLESKSRKLNRPPIDWSSSQGPAEDPAITLQREKSEHMRRQREQDQATRESGIAAQKVRRMAANSDRDGRNMPSQKMGSPPVEHTPRALGQINQDRRMLQDRAHSRQASVSHESSNRERVNNVEQIQSAGLMPSLSSAAANSASQESGKKRAIKRPEPTGRWPSPVKNFRNGDVFAEFARNYSQLKSVKREREEAQPNQDDRWIDVLGWEL